MAAQPTLADVQAQAQQLAAEIAANPVNAADRAQIVATAKKLLMLMDLVQPHLNAASSSGLVSGAVVSQANDLRNKLNKVIATYSA